MGLAIFSTTLLSTTFRFKRQEYFIPPRDAPTQPTEIISRNKYKQIMSHKVVHLLGAFIFVNVGVRFSIGGWIVTFIIDVRKGGSSAGYISSGFFGGWYNKVGLVEYLTNSIATRHYSW
ncbi:hypothetical protein FRC03_003107 [Tulasnella sp. 419]|nr:hypothetical protein FRC03_003107 [Tulasnella sp. 419]